MSSWREAKLVAVDLEGSGAQDRESEVILEVAVVPLINGDPIVQNAFATVINPGRPVPRRPWISPALLGGVLAGAPPLGAVAPELTARLSGKVIVGHNVSVDWRLLHRQLPGVRPAALIDTLRLARTLHSGKGNALTALLSRYRLTEAVSAIAPGSRPHRALWDAVGAALLLKALVDALPRHGAGGDVSFAALQDLAGRPCGAASEGPGGDTRSGQTTIVW